MSPRWEKVGGPREYNPGETGGLVDSTLGWAYDFERGGVKAILRVEVAGTVDASSSGVSSESREAIATRGWSAIRGYLEDDELPIRLIISTAGVTLAD
jgi:hypothetical protein